MLRCLFAFFLLFAPMAASHPPKVKLEVLELGVAIQTFRNAELWEELVAHDAFTNIIQVNRASLSTAEEIVREHQERQVDAISNTIHGLPAGFALPVVLVGSRYAYSESLQKNFNKITSFLKPRVELKLADFLPGADLEKAMTRVQLLFENNPSLPVILLFSEDNMAPIPSATAVLLGRREALKALRFNPSPWVPKPLDPLTRQHLSALKPMAILHPTTAVSYLKAGAPMGDHSKAEAFKAVWKALLAKLPPRTIPNRFIFDHGSAAEGRKVVPLTISLYATDPDLDIFKEGVNLHTRLGDLGSASPFVGLAVGILAGHQLKNPTACVDLRADEGADITLIQCGKDLSAP